MDQRRSPNFWLTGRGAIAAGGIGFLLYFLVIEHGEHLFPYLPYLILLLCPFMHFFMHGSHGHSHEHDQQGSSASDDYKKGYEDAMKQERTKKGDIDA